MRFALLIAFSVCILQHTSNAQELPRVAPMEVGLSAKKLENVKSIIEDAIAKKQTPGVVVLIARHGKVAYFEAFGKSNVAANTPMPLDAIFRIRSMSKPITSVAALMLLEEGKFKLDDPVSQYLPEFRGLRVYPEKGTELVAAKQDMTVRDLMRHTSGLTYGMPNGTAVDQLYISKGVEGTDHTLAELVTIVGKLPLQSQPGTRFNYSISTDVLSRLVEVVSGKPFDQFLNERILRPLDMPDTGFVVPADKLPRLTAAHFSSGQGTLRVTDDPATSRYRTSRKYLSGGGGLLSTARDYSRFCQMLLNKGELNGVRMLRSETVKEMTSNQLPESALPMTISGFPLPGMGFGLGVSVLLDAKSPTPLPNAGEFGWNGAASTYFWVAPSSEMVVVILQQIEPYNFMLQMTAQPAIYAAIE